MIFKKHESDVTALEYPPCLTQALSTELQLPTPVTSWPTVSCVLGPLLPSPASSCSPGVTLSSLQHDTGAFSVLLLFPHPGKCSPAPACHPGSNSNLTSVRTSLNAPIYTTLLPHHPPPTPFIILPVLFPWEDLPTSKNHLFNVFICVPSLCLSRIKVPKAGTIFVWSPFVFSREQWIAHVCWMNAWRMNGEDACGAFYVSLQIRSSIKKSTPTKKKKKSM